MLSGTARGAMRRTIAAAEVTASQRFAAGMPLPPLLQRRQRAAALNSREARCGGNR